MLLTSPSLITLLIPAAMNLPFDKSDTLRFPLPLLLRLESLFTKANPGLIGLSPIEKPVTVPDGAPGGYGNNDCECLGEVCECECESEYCVEVLEIEGLMAEVARGRAWRVMGGEANVAERGAS